MASNKKEIERHQKLTPKGQYYICNFQNFVQMAATSIRSDLAALLVSTKTDRPIGLDLPLE